LVEELGEYTESCELEEWINEVHDLHRLVMEADLARSFEPEYVKGKGQLSDILCKMIESGQTVTAVDYNNAVARMTEYYHAFDKLFEEHDAIITPAAPGEAPVGLGSTGSPVFCTIWTYFGMPAVNLPLLQGEQGMPLGVQLVGARGDDARLLRTARWLVEKVADL